MQVEEALLRVLEDEAGPLHSTVIQDFALRRGYLDPFEHKQLRSEVLRALTQLAGEGKIARVDKGVYALPN
jgi:hypothetical protein